jgi:hypothetical protein
LGDARHGEKMLQQSEHTDLSLGGDIKTLIRGINRDVALAPDFSLLCGSSAQGELGVARRVLA